MELVLPRHGSYERVQAPQTAVIAGGGLAGVAAAVVLAERGVSVVLAERESFLGGRAGAWTDRLATGEAFEMERGFHSGGSTTGSPSSSPSRTIRSSAPAARWSPSPGSPTNLRGMLSP
jgi:monoamine oxidase